MFTPQEVSEKVFPKASFGSGGYSMSSVDEFLDALTEDYTAIFKENVTLKAKLKVLAEKVEEYRSTEEAMRQALLTAQKMASKLVQEAQSEKEEILAKARVEAQEEIHRLDAERQAIINRYMNQTKFDDEGEYRYVKVDESGKDVVEEDDYRIVRADGDEKPEGEEGQGSGETEDLQEPEEKEKQ